jgi:hypothetical protein
MEGAIAREPSYLEELEQDGGRCPICAARAVQLTCWQCCDSTWMIDCEHRTWPRPMVRGRADGSERHRVFCAECAGEPDD